MTDKIEQYRIRFEMSDGIEYATLRADIFREAMLERDRLRAALEKWRPAVERTVKWSEMLGNERDAKGFAAMLADFDSALARDNCP